MRSFLPTRLALAFGLTVAPFAGCQSPPADDDSATPAPGDDDSSPAASFLAPRIGLFTLIHLADGEAGAYVEWSGAFADFSEATTTEALAVGGYLGTYTAYGSFWRYDLGGYPIPPLGEDRLEDLTTYETFVPDQKTWWDGGERVGLGPWLTNKILVDADENPETDPLVAYQVDDPLSPGGEGWVPGARVSFENTGGVDVVAWSFADAVVLPGPMVLTEPPGSVLDHPLALDLAVSWTPQDDGAFVTVTLLQGLGVVWTASVEDSAAGLVVPGTMTQESFLPGEAALIVGRTLETELETPQGDIVVRTREERRVTLNLGAALTVDPAWGSPGWSGDLVLTVGVSTLGDLLSADFGEGVVAGAPQAGVAPGTWVLPVTIDSETSAGERTVTLTGVSEGLAVAGAFSVLTLPPQDGCGDEGEALADGVWTSSTAGLTDDFGTGITCLTWTLDGPDAVYPVDLLAGETLDVALDAPAPVDGALMLLSNCADGSSALICVDVGFEGDAESLLWTATEDGRVHLVVEGYAADVGGPFTLTVARSGP